MFHEWFRKHVEGLVDNGAEVPEEIQILANEPFMITTMYSSYTINGFNFHTYSSDEGRLVQSSGVALVAQTSCFENGNNMNPIVQNKTYYGRIKEIIELNYRNKGSIVLFKRVGNEMCEELGRPPRRDELFIKTHTHKNGVPQKGAKTTINALKDVYFHVCGLEKNGYVRVVGLGPTPAELDMPGAKKCTSTRLQMEIEARRQADNKKVEALENRLDSLQQKLDMLIQLQQNGHSTQNESNNSALVSGANLAEEPENHYDDIGSHARDEIENMQFSDDENMFITRHSVVFPEKQQEEGGRDVILYNIARPYSLPVAKGTVQTTNPSSIVGGTPLGIQYCEVVVNHVFVKDAILPRPYGALKSVGDASRRCIAWPHDRMKDDKNSSRQSKVSRAGT